MLADHLIHAIERDPSRDRIEHVIIEHRAGKGWVAVLSYAGLSRMHPRDLDDTVDLAVVPEGVAVRAFARDPDTVVLLPAPHGDVRETMRVAIGRLAESGLLGSPLTVDRHDPASLDSVARNPWPKWYIYRGPAA